MNLLTLIDPKVLGEKHPTYGFSVWSETDSDYPVMFNVMDEKNLLPQVRVTYEEAQLKTSSKGKEYLRLKKVRFEDNPVSKADVVPFTKKPEPTFSKSEPDNKFLKDTTDLPYRVWKDMLPLMDAQSLIKDDNYNRQLNEYVMKQSDELLRMIDGVRRGEPNPATNEPKPATPLRSAWEDRKNLPSAITASDEHQYSDSDIPEDL